MSMSLNYSEDHITTIAYNLLCAVNFTQTANIMHRDIKPANILIDQSCGIYICDFGLSRVCPQENYSIEKDDLLSDDSDLGDVYTQDIMPSPSTKVHKRILSGHISSRWYRSPETILLEQNYTS